MNLQVQAEKLIISRYNGEMGMMPVVMKSLIHDEVVPALQKSGLLKYLIFQGETALQRFYDNRRFSEDLDFVCGKGKSLKLSPEDFMRLGPTFETSVKETLAKRYSLEVDSLILKSPNDPYALRGQDVKVQVWQLKVPISSHGARQMVKIEIANVPAYKVEPKIWPNMTPASHDLEPAPTVVLNVETQEEIMADKVVALACRNHVKFRDIWDYHMLQSQGVKAGKRDIVNKLKDYGMLSEKVPTSCKDKLSSLAASSTVSKFWKEMDRFVFPSSKEMLKESGIAQIMIETACTALKKTKRMVESELDSGLGTR